MECAHSRYAIAVVVAIPAGLKADSVWVVSSQVGLDDWAVDTDVDRVRVTIRVLLDLIILANF